MYIKVKHFRNKPTSLNTLKYNRLKGTLETKNFEIVYSIVTKLVRIVGSNPDSSRNETPGFYYAFYISRILPFGSVFNIALLLNKHHRLEHSNKTQQLSRLFPMSASSQLHKQRLTWSPSPPLREKSHN